MSTKTTRALCAAILLLHGRAGAAGPDPFPPANPPPSALFVVVDPGKSAERCRATLVLAARVLRLALPVPRWPAALGPLGGERGLGSCRPGPAPLAEALRQAGTKLLERRAPRGQRRILLVLTAAESADEDAVKAAAALRGRGVVSFVVGLPGHAPAAADALARAGGTAAPAGGPGVLRGRQPEELVLAIEAAVFHSLRGRYPSSPGATAPVGLLGPGRIGLIPAFEYPGWKGLLFAVDFRRSCRAATDCRPSDTGCSAAGASQPGFCVLWEAGSRLGTRIETKSRRLYTGFPGLNGSRAIPLARARAGSWQPCLGGEPGCPAQAVRAVWQAVGRYPGDAAARETVRFILDKPLGALIASTPAAVGVPPAYRIPDHETFALEQRDRENLIYIASTDGILHALRTRSGEELFGYVPPDAWPAIHRLARQRGQDPDPQRFIWALGGASPRVEDSRLPGGGWRTELILPPGPSGDGFSSIDITAPARCADGVSRCQQLAERSFSGEPVPFTMIARSRRLPGKTTPQPATPALFWDEQRKLGLSAGPALLDLERRMVGSVEATTDGMVSYYDRAAPSAPRTIIAAGAGQPFHFAPAVLHRGQALSVLAAVSGTPGRAAAASTIFLRGLAREAAPTGLRGFSLEVHRICSAAAAFEVPSGACRNGPPSAQARPVARPILVENQHGGVDLLVLLIEPDLARSWLVQLWSDLRRSRLVLARRYQAPLTGVLVLGAGEEIALTAITRVGEGPLLLTRRGGPLRDRGGAGAPIVESWREVP